MDNNTTAGQAYWIIRGCLKDGWDQWQDDDRIARETLAKLQEHELIK